MEKNHIISTQRTRRSTSPSFHTRYSSIESDSDFSVQNARTRWSGKSHSGNENVNTLSIEVDGTKMGEVSSFHTISGVTDLELSADVSMKVPQHSYICHCGQLRKEIISTAFMFVVMVVGIVTVAIFRNSKTHTGKTVVDVCQVLRAAGIFGFVGGVANWIGIKLMFDRLLWLPCSGIIARHHADLRESINTFVMGTLFQQHYIRRYVDDKLEQVLGPEQVDHEIQQILDCETVERLIEQKLDFLMGTKEGLMLQLVGVSKTKLHPLIKPYLLGLKKYIRPLLLSASQSLDLIRPEKLREQIADVISMRSHELAPKHVKRILKEALYSHFSVVVVWGSVLGALTGGAMEVIGICIGSAPG